LLASIPDYLKGSSMRWAARLMTSAAAMLLTASGASAATQALERPADAAWAAAVASNSLEAYAAFVMKYPESEHARAAYDRLSGASTAGTGAGATPGSASLFGDEQNEQSSPGILPGMIMII
jgi:hypothetical protein